MGTVAFQYQILRYRHDVATGEFVNVGLVYFDTQSRFLRARMTQKYERIARFFGEIEGEHLLRTFKGLENEFNRLAQSLKYDSANRPFHSVSELTSSVLPPNDNALSFSPIVKGFDIDHNTSFNDLYYCLIGKYNGENEEPQYPQTSNGNATIQTTQAQNVLIAI